MPEIRPVLNKIDAFDSVVGSTISFSWTGAQSQKNRLVIKEYDSPHRIVYDCTQKTMSLKHTLHITGDEESNITQNISYGLVNGKRYLATVYIYDVYDNESLPSREVAFYCFHTPVFSFINFTNISTDNIAKVSTNSVYLNVKYSQSDGEVLNEYKFRLFDHTGTELLSSKTFYGSTPDDTLQWTLGGITDTGKQPNGELNYSNAYKIVCEAITAHGMDLYTEQKFVVQKDTGGVGALLTLESLPDRTISISSHFKITNVSLDGEEIYLKDTDKNPFAIDLTEGKSISYFDGFNMSAPWSMTAIVGNCDPNSVLMTCTNNLGDSFTIRYVVKEYTLSKKAFFYFQCTRESTHYILRSDYLPPSNNWYIIYLKYADGYFTFKVYDPEELGYDLPDNCFPDKVLSNEDNIFVQKNIVVSSDVAVGESKLEFSMPVDFSDKYTFDIGKYYEIQFSADNIIQNNYNSFTLFKSNDISVNSDELYIRQSDNKYVIHYHCTEDLPSPQILVKWSNKYKIDVLKDFYNSATYCVITNVDVCDMLEAFDSNNVYAKTITPTSTGVSTSENSIAINLAEKGFEFVSGYKYLIKFSFKNIVANDIGTELFEADSCTANLSDISISGKVLEFEYIYNEEQSEPIINISWNNEYNCAAVGGTATSFGIIDDIDVIDIEHPDILNGKIYQYKFENPVSTLLGDHTEEFRTDFRIDTKYLTDSTRVKDKCLNNGEEYILKFKATYLYDLYYGVSINHDITFTAEFLGYQVTFKSGEEVIIPFIYTETTDNLKVHISWIQESKNLIDSQYSRGKTYLLINDIKYGYEKLLDMDIYDYDYATKLEISNIDPSIPYEAAYTIDTNKSFTGSGSYKLKELFNFYEDFKYNITTKLEREIVRPEQIWQSLVGIELNSSVLLDNTQVDLIYNTSTNKNEAELVKQYTSINNDTKCDLTWTEDVTFNRDLSGGTEIQKYTIYIIVWLSKIEIILDEISEEIVV